MSEVQQGGVGFTSLTDQVASGMAEPQPSFLVTSEDEAAYRAAVEAGLVSLDAGRGVPLADVRRWMATWFREGELPPPECP